MSLAFISTIQPRLDAGISGISVITELSIVPIRKTLIVSELAVFVKASLNIPFLAPTYPRIIINRSMASLLIRICTGLNLCFYI